MGRVFTVERYYPPSPRSRDRWELLAYVSDRVEAERLVAYLQAGDKSCTYSFHAEKEDIYSSADEYIQTLMEKRKVS